MNEVAKLIEIAKAEIGYLEKKNNSQLDSKTANAGKNNYTKYARDLDNISGFYNGKKQGYAWCDVFVDWCFVQAFGVQRAMELLNQPKKSTGAGCGFSMDFYKKVNQFYTTPKIGDQIFFKEGNSISHTGLVYKVDNTYVYTIEGNTSSDAGVVANGGSVNDKKYKLGSSYIAGYGRPKYKVENTSNPNTSKDTPKETEKDRIKDLQRALNKDNNSKLAVDGIIGPATKKVIMDNYLSNFTRGNFVKWTQTQLKRKGYNIGSYGIDGCYGNDTEKTVRKYQKDKGLTVDGCVGIEVVKSLVK